MCSLDLRSSIKACVVKFKELNDLILPLRMLSFFEEQTSSGKECEFMLT